MCLYTKMVKNPKYKPNKKNGGKAPICTDERVLYIPVGCGNCIECRKKKQREWKVRMMEEIKHDHTGKFVTLTFNEESIKKLEIESGTKEANAVATKAVRWFLERWRKKYKKSVKHWLITELGHNNTERLHIHGIIFTEKTKEEIEERWQYGKIDVGYSMGERCVNYVMKYVTKVDKDHEGFVGKILTSKGIGSGYIGGWDAGQRKFKKGKTDETYRLKSGNKIALPTYYRNKIYSEEEREKLWIEKIEKGEMYVGGKKINILKKGGEEELKKATMYLREISGNMGYGRGEKKKMYLTRNNIKNLDEEIGSHILAEETEKRNRYLEKVKQLKLEENERNRKGIKESTGNYGRRVKEFNDKNVRRNNNEKEG